MNTINNKKKGGILVVLLYHILYPLLPHYYEYTISWGRRDRTVMLVVVCESYHVLWVNFHTSIYTMMVPWGEKKIALLCIIIIYLCEILIMIKE